MSTSARFWIGVAVVSGVILIVNREWLVSTVLTHQVTIVDRFLVHFIAAPIIAAAAAFVVTMRRRARDA